MKINKSSKKKESCTDIIKKGKTGTSKNTNKLGKSIKLGSISLRGIDAIGYYKFL